MWMLFLISAVGAADAQLLRFLSPSDLIQAEGVQLRAQRPESEHVLIAEDPARPKLWYMPAATVPIDGGARIWYQRVDKDAAEYSDQRTFCVGEYASGAWRLPALEPGAPAWGGPGNVCLRRSPYPPTWGGFNVFQMVRHEDRYRLLYWDQPEDGPAGAMLATSPDGLAWEKDAGGAVFTEHNDAFTLLRHNGEFLLYQTMLEDWPDKPYPDNLDKKRRVQSLRRSPDLRAWTPQEVFLRPDAQDKPETEFYLMKAFPYGGKFLGLIMKYFGDPNRPKQHSALLENELVVSTDAVHWERPFRNDDLGFWTYADPFPHEDALCFAIGADRALKTVSYRPNRLTAVTAESEGTFLTQPFPAPRNGLALDADTANGWIDLELRDSEGRPIPGIALARIQGVNDQRIPVTWTTGNPTQLPNMQYQLRIRLHQARLYALLLL